MRRVIIRRGTLELASAGLTRPIVTIGRSPACDVVLRASGIKPVHFMLEWVGGGDFDPNTGYWSIFDISQSAEEVGEGVILSDEPLQFRGFQILCREDKLTTEWDGGGISDTLAPAQGAAGLKPISKNGYVLEVVQGRSDSGAIEEVLHLHPRRFSKKLKPLEKVPEFKILWNPEQKASETIRVLTSEMPGAVVYQKGVQVEAGKSPDLWPNDLLEIRWNGLRFFLRLVPWTNPPKVRSDFFQDKLLVGLFAAALLIGVSITVLSNLHPVSDQIAQEAPPRIAKVEIQRLEAAPPPKAEVIPPAPVQEQKEVVPAETKVVEGGAKKEIESPVVQKNTKANLAKPKVKPNPGPKRSGLNVATAPAAPKDVNTMGLLGALKKTSGGPKGSGIKADQIVDQGLIASAVSGDQGKVVLKSGAIGDLGHGSKGSPKGDGSSLAQASTTLSGNHEFNPRSTGPIAGAGGNASKDFAAGSVLGTGGGHGAGNGSGGLDGSGSGGFQTSGGLTRDVVRAIIGKYRSQIRNCYERALLVNSDLAGRILYEWKISPAGPVVSVKLLRTDVHFDKLEGCVRDVIRSMQFPAAENGQSTTVIYPFAFQSHKKN
jgi:hypothetical protein